MRNLLPLFLDLVGRDVLLVGGGPVASAKLRQLLAAGARVRVVSPLVLADIDRLGRSAHVHIALRAFQPSDLDGVWLAVAAATPDVNRVVAQAAQARRVFVNAVDDPENATAYLSGVVRRADVTIAISTSGDAPALTSLIREALDAVLPDDLSEWVETAREQRAEWRRDRVPMNSRKPLLLRALNDLYPTPIDRDVTTSRVPWLSGPEDSWL
jgi:uroporphyrin-III C-methyltransferase / precorrin-2 dehydrogenase / sirohydrochlorin ferrochelatase